MRWTPAMSAKATLTPVFGSCIWIQISFEIWILDLNYKISFPPSIHVYVHTLYSLEVKNDEKVCKECERDCVFSKSERLAEAALTTNYILAMPLCLLFVFIGIKHQQIRSYLPQTEHWRCLCVGQPQYTGSLVSLRSWTSAQWWIESL